VGGVGRGQPGRGGGDGVGRERLVLGERQQARRIIGPAAVIGVDEAVRQAGVRERCPRDRRQYGVDPDVVLAQFQRQASHQPDQPVLGRGVRGQVTLDGPGPQGSGGQEYSRTALHHVRGHRLGRAPDAGQVDVDDRLPGLLVDLGERLGVHDARVGHGHVDMAERIETEQHGPVQGVLIADVHVAQDAPASVGPDEFAGLREIAGGRGRVGRGPRRLLGVAGDDVRPLARERGRQRATDPLGGSRDQDNPVGVEFHTASSARVG